MRRLCSSVAKSLAQLAEADVSSLLAEALTRKVDAVLADERVAVAGDSALTRAFAVAARVGIPSCFVACLRLHFFANYSVNS